MVTNIILLLSTIMFAVIFKRMYGSMWLFLTVCYVIMGIAVVLGP